MTDIRRVTLNSVSPVEKETKVKKEPVTFRFHLTLGESNSTSCPEYSFTDLVKQEKGKLHPNDSFLDDRSEDADVARIAQQFEEKYGGNTRKKGVKKRTQEMDDYFDMGEGYDSEDSFIDNTEAYDEVIPSTLTTKYGGFYINQGKLDFRSISDDSTDSVFQGQDKKKKKNVIESDSEEETGEALRKKYRALKKMRLQKKEERKKKKLSEEERKRKKTMADANGEVVKKRKKKILDLHKQKKINPVKPVLDNKPVQSPSSQGLSPNSKAPIPSSVVVTAAVSTSSAVASSTISTTSATTSVTSTPVSVSINHESAVGSTIPDDPSDLQNVYASILEETMKDESSSKSGDDEKKSEKSSGEKSTQLPSQLPFELLDSIEVMKKEAKERKEGKSKFFSADINKLLLDIEMGSLKLPKSQRSAIFNHLSEHLPSGKVTLLRRAKKLREEEDLLKGPVGKLKTAISKLMPALEEQHEKAAAKLRLESKAELSEAMKEEASTESEEEEGKSETKKVIRRRARRKFEWTPETRGMFLDIVQSKMKKYDASKSKNQQPEDYLKNYLESEIKPIWPPGWMNTRLLYKIARTSKEETTKGTKPKKTTVLKPSVQETTLTQRVSRVEDVIEISSIIDDDIEEKKNVVVNLFDKNPSSPSQYSQQSISVLGGPSSMSSALLPPAQTSLTPSSSQATVQSSLPLNDFNPNSGAFGPKLPEKAVSKPIGASNSALKAPSPVIEIMDSMSPIKPDALLSPSVFSNPLLGAHSKSASSLISPQSQPPSTSKGATGTNTTSPFSTSTPNSSQSFLQAFNQYLNQTHPKKDEAANPNKGAALANQSSQHQQMSSKSIGNNSAFPQSQKKTQQLASSSYQDKTTPPSSKLQFAMSSAPLPKISQDFKTTGLSTKGGLPSSNGQNPVRSPVVTINRIPTSSLKSSQKPQQSLTYAGSNKGPFSQSQKPSMQQQKQQSQFPAQSQNLLPQHNLSLKKKTQQPVSSSQTISTSGLLSSSASRAGKPSPMLSPVSMSSAKQGSSSAKVMSSPPSQLSGALPTTNSVGAAQRKTPPTSQLKSGIVLGTSIPPKLSPQQQQLHRQHLHQQQRSQMKSGVVLSSSSSSTPLSVRTSPVSSSSMAANKKISPTNSLLHSASLLSASRASTLSPQKSPVSPSNSPLSLYDHIQSQIRNQEATEEQGLKALAMALNYGQIATPSPKHLSGQGTGNSSPRPGNR